MGSNASAPLSPAEARHLVRRTGFGASAKTVQTILKRYPTRGAAADYLLKFKPSRFKPRGAQPQDLHNSWIRYMLSTRTPLQEKLVLFWHDHFATGIDKVNDTGLMGKQNQLLRQFCKGNFSDFVKAINTNAAMMVYLDTVRNRKNQPNENYARELQELLTLGVTDLAGNPNYTQDDIVQIARAFTGWTFDRTNGSARFNASAHDSSTPKLIYKTTGGFGASGVDVTQPGGAGIDEIDQVIDVILQHTDSDGKTTAARYIAGKLLLYFSQPGAKRPVPAALAPVIDTVVAESGFDTNWDISKLLRALFVNDAFYETAAPAPFTSDTEKSVKWPVDYVVGTLRLLGMKLTGSDQHIGFHPEKNTSIYNYLTGMGQVVFLPPSIFGWDWDTAWLSSATLIARYTFANDLISARGSNASAFRPQKLINLNLTDAGAIVDAVTGALGISDQYSDTERDIFVNYLTDGTAAAAINLLDDTVRNTKLNGLFALVLQSATYQLH